MKNESLYTMQARTAIREAYDKLAASGSTVIKSGLLAVKAIDTLDPEQRIAGFYRFHSCESLKHLARVFLQHTGHDTESAALSEVGEQPIQHGLFGDALQDYYHVKRNGEDCNVRRSALTTQERREIAAWLRRMSASFEKHADALDAETDAMAA